MITFPQAIVADAIGQIVKIRACTHECSGVLRLWIGPPHVHRSSWFDVSPIGEITATTRGGGTKLMLDDVSVDALSNEAARLVAWVT